MAAPRMACFIVTLLLDTLVAHELATSLAPEKQEGTGQRSPAIGQR